MTFASDGAPIANSRTPDDLSSTQRSWTLDFRQFAKDTNLKAPVTSDHDKVKEFAEQRAAKLKAAGNSGKPRAKQGGVRSIGHTQVQVNSSSPTSLLGVNNEEFDAWLTNMRSDTHARLSICPIVADPDAKITDALVPSVGERTFEDGVAIRRSQRIANEKRIANENVVHTHTHTHDTRIMILTTVGLAHPRSRPPWQPPDSRA